MKSHFLLLPLLYFMFFNWCSSAQIKNQVLLEGRVIDSKTLEPVIFANVGFFQKEIGTVTDENGYFNLTYFRKDISPDDVLQVSVIGYQTQKLGFAEFGGFSQGAERIIYINPIAYGLNEVVLDGKKQRRITIGNPKPSPARFGYWKSKEGLGGEIATRIKIGKKDTKLENLHFQILANMSDSLLIRVNVYDIHPGYFEPRKNILKKAVYHTITSRYGIETIPLANNNIVVDDDVIVSIELVKVYGERIGFAVQASGNKKSSYLRSSSQGAWKKYKGQAMAFTMDVSYPSNNTSEVTTRVKPQEVIVYWDASAKPIVNTTNPIDEGIMSRELQLLERYLNSLKTVDVTVHKFALGYHETKTFLIKKASSEAVIDYLEETTYEGETDYSALQSSVSERTKNILVFTDGNSFISKLQPVFNSPTFTINSSPFSNIEALEDLSLYTDGAHIDLQNLSIKEAYNQLVKDIALPEKDVRRPYEIKGFLTSPLESLAGVKIFNASTKQTAVANQAGDFEIQASEGDRLLISYPGLQNKSLVVSNDEELRINLSLEGDWLNEVVLTGEGKKELIESSIGKKDFNAVTTKSDVITSKDIRQQHITLEDVLDNEPQIEILKHPINGETLFTIPRTLNMSINTPTLPIVVIDGAIYEQNPLDIVNQSAVGERRFANSVPYVDVQSISSIVVTSSLSATVLYGSIAAGGAIVIKTKSYSKENVPSTPESLDKALITGNDYTEITKSIDEFLSVAPYANQLAKAINIAQVNHVYTYYRKTEYAKAPGFYIDMAKAFLRFDKNKALRVLSSISAETPYNIPALQLLAYEFEEFGELELATKVYQQILLLEPNRIQSYRDLALAYQNNGQYDLAFTLYKQMLANDTQAIDFTPLKKTIENELMHLLAFHKSEVSFEDLPNTLLDVSFKKDRRLVFEWTEPEADFEIQFVNPQGKFFTWKHDKIESMNRIQSEFTQGYNMEEFALDDAPPGEWLVNIQYFEDTSTIAPVYLKYTVFLNYATPDERKMTKLIKLHEQTDKVTLGKLLLE